MEAGISFASEQEAEEAARLARIAARAEARAAERRAAAALCARDDVRATIASLDGVAAAVKNSDAVVSHGVVEVVDTALDGHATTRVAASAPSSTPAIARPTYMSKAEREAAALQRLQERRQAAADAHGIPGTTSDTRAADPAASSTSRVSDAGQHGTASSAAHRRSRSRSGSPARGRLTGNRTSGRGDDRAGGGSQRDRGGDRGDGGRGRDSYVDRDRSYLDRGRDRDRDADRDYDRRARDRDLDRDRGRDRPDRDRYERDQHDRDRYDRDRYDDRGRERERGRDRDWEREHRGDNDRLRVERGGTGVSDTQRRSAVGEPRRDAGGSATGNAPGNGLTAPSVPAVLGRVDAPVYNEDPAVAAERQRAAQAVRDKYMGHKEVKSRVVKPSEKFTRVFKFDWDAAEDTSVDSNPLYAQRLEPSLLFGRGRQAGVAEAARAAHVSREHAGRASLMQDGERPMELDAAPTVPAPAVSATRNARDVLGKHAVPGSHWSEKPLEAMTDRDWRIMREDFDIFVRGGRAVNPLRKWSEASIHPMIQRAIDEAGYKEPTPIQRQAIPMGLQSRDLLGVAETGSGKTAAFMIPLLTYVLGQPDAARERTADSGPLALVMAPTRELAQQIEEECVKLARYTGLRSLAVVGGVGIQEQGARLRDGVHVIIGTPGRLVDALEQAYLVLHQCRYIVLDEADKMIDMGFEPQVTAVMDAMGGAPANVGDSVSASAASTDASALRITHMFTATMPPDIERLAKKYLRTPAIVKIGDEDSGKNRRITQEMVFLASESKKKSKLLEVLGKSERPVIIFLNAKKACDVIARDLESAGITSATVLHSGKTQDFREEALASFKAGEYDILIATDVAGRGLDIPDVAHVINYDMPADIDRYTHRIGRTGRAGKTGKSTTFLTEEDAAVLPALKAYLESTGQPVLPDLASRASGQGDGENVRYARK